MCRDQRHAIDFVLAVNQSFVFLSSISHHRQPSQHWKSSLTHAHKQVGPGKVEEKALTDNIVSTKKAKKRNFYLCCTICADFRKIPDQTWSYGKQKAFNDLCTSDKSVESYIYAHMCMYAYMHVASQQKSSTPGVLSCLAKNGEILSKSSLGSSMHTLLNYFISFLSSQKVQRVKNARERVGTPFFVTFSLPRCCWSHLSSWSSCRTIFGRISGDTCEFRTDHTHWPT